MAARGSFAGAWVAMVLAAGCIPVGPPLDGATLVPDGGTPVLDAGPVDRSCDYSGDCRLFEDCCACDAVRTTYEGLVPGACPDMQCDATQCDNFGIGCAVCDDGTCELRLDPEIAADKSCLTGADCVMRTSCCACYASAATDTSDPLTCCEDMDCFQDECSAENAIDVDCFGATPDSPGICQVLYGA